MSRPAFERGVFCWLSAAVLVFFVGCSDSTTSPPDADVEDMVSGDTIFDIEVRAPFCGDGFVDDGEDCDDGNGVDADACSNTCALNIADLCEHCETDADCGGGGLCLEMDEGTFCGFDCSDSDNYCGGGFECLDIVESTDDGDRVVARQCFPIDSCENIDECTLYPGICGEGDCTDADPGYTCVCFDGYELNENSSSCVDVDECSDDPDICGPGECTNTLADYDCLCPFPYSNSSGSCTICPAEDALSMTLAAPGECTLLAEADHQALLNRVLRNLRWVLIDTIEAPQFIEFSPLYRQMVRSGALFEGGEGEGGGIPFAQAADYVAEFADMAEQEVLLTEYISSSDACSLTFEIPIDALCDDSGESFGFPCGPDTCGDGHVCAENGNCTPMDCTTDDNCNDGWECGDSDTCEEICIFETMPIRIVVWPVGDEDVYAEVIVGNAPNTANPIDLRIFQDQIAVIADLGEAIDTLYLVSEAQGDEEPMWPDPEDVEGILEVDLHEIETGGYALEVNVRTASTDGSDTGILAEWTIDDFFDSYVNETPLPLSVALGQACPLVYLDANDTDNILTVGAGLRPIEAIVPFAFLDEGSDDECEYDAEAAVPCTCYELNESDNPVVADCPCYDDDGMPIACGTTTTVGCPYDQDGDPVACLPNVGSLKAHIDGFSFRVRGSVGDEFEDEIHVDHLGFGGGETTLERDDDPIGTFKSIGSMSFNESRVDPMSEIIVMLSGGVSNGRDSELSVWVDLVSELELDVALNLDNISDRLVDLPDMLQAEVIELLLAGDTPLLRVDISEDTLRPVQLLSGEISAYSKYLEDNEDPAREPAGTVLIAEGKCIRAIETEGDLHPFEMFEGVECPVAIPVQADVTLLENDAAVNYGDDIDLTVGSGRMTLLHFDLTDAPSSYESARLDVYLDDWFSPMSGNFDVHEVTAAWVESTATWNNPPTIASTPTDSMLHSEMIDDYGYRSFDVTALVDDWFASPASNFGFALVNSTSTGYAVFPSVDYEDGAYSPRLILEQ